MSINGLAGTVTLYYPNNEIEKNIETYLKHIETLYVIENSPEEMSDISKRIIDHPKIKLIHSGENRGISFALNKAAEQAKKDGFDWLLCMDQDSRFVSDHVLKLIDGIEHHGDAIILAPTYDTGMYSVETSPDWRVVDEVFTSGNLLNLTNYEELGPFDEGFFIDYVDNEYCLRIKKLGKKIFQNCECILKHNLGNPSRVKFFHKSLTTTNHAPIRLYYRTRNRLYCWVKYPSFILKDINRLWKELVLVFLFEKQKLLKAKWILLGIIHFALGKKGAVK